MTLKDKFLEDYIGNGDLARRDLEAVIAEAISLQNESRLKHFCDFLEHRYPISAAGISFKKAIEVYLKIERP